jgi:hypothetical protein
MITFHVLWKEITVTGEFFSQLWSCESLQFELFIGNDIFGERSFLFCYVHVHCERNAETITRKTESDERGWSFRNISLSRFFTRKVNIYPMATLMGKAAYEIEKKNRNFLITYGMNWSKWVPVTSHLVFWFYIIYFITDFSLLPLLLLLLLLLLHPLLLLILITKAMPCYLHSWSVVGNAMTCRSAAPTGIFRRFLRPSAQMLACS